MCPRPSHVPAHQLQGLFKNSSGKLKGLLKYVLLLNVSQSPQAVLINPFSMSPVPATPLHSSFATLTIPPFTHLTNHDGLLVYLAHQPHAYLASFTPGVPSAWNVHPQISTWLNPYLPPPTILCNQLIYMHFMPLEYKPHRTVVFVWLTDASQVPEQDLAHTRDSIYICIE